MTPRTLLLAGLAGLAGLLSACASPEPAGELALDLGDLEPGVPGAGKADDAGDLAVHDLGDVALIDVYGPIALDLERVLIDAGLPRTRRGDLDVVSGRRLGCVSRRGAAACRLVAPPEAASAGFLVSFHGPRSGSLAAELFGALARADGTSPASVTEIESARFACGKDRTTAWCGVRPAEQARRRLVLELPDLRPLGAAYVYEGWLVSDRARSTGRFGLVGDARTVRRWLAPEVYRDARRFVLTIEPALGDVPAASATHVVAGDLVDDAAALSSAHASALGSDFASATGSYLLATPSTASIDDDYAQGVWFVAAGAPSLVLPTLPTGWVYEGWAVSADGEVRSTGRFRDVAGPDGDGPGPAAGPDGGPPFPGQDYIDPALLLTSGRVVLTVEPEPDDAPGGFPLAPLADLDVVDVGAGVPQAMAAGPRPVLAGALELR